MSDSIPPDEALPDVDLDGYEMSLLKRQSRWALATGLFGAVLMGLSVLAVGFGGRGSVTLVLAGIVLVGRGVTRWRSAGAAMDEVGRSRAR